ncbi:MAG: imidazole glycerol phosphate synthase subunit HisH, partial [Gemmatimonadetes bacterium]
MDVTVFDYGAGNLHSLAKALERAGPRVRVSSGLDAVLGADALVLPGVGAFAAALEALEPLREPLCERLAEGLPLLGICLGMQLLFEQSEEGPGRGLGWI